MADALDVQAEGSPAIAADKLASALSAAATGAMRDEGARVKAALQGDMKGLGKLAKSWRVTVFPRSGQSYDPAMQVLNKDGDIIEAFSNGVTVVAHNRRWLAIPSPQSLKLYRASAQPKVGGQFAERAPWPGVVAALLGGKPMTFIAPGGDRGFIYVQTGKTRKIIGWLERQAVLGKRIEGTALLQRVAEGLPADYGARFDQYLSAELKAAGEGRS